VGTVTFDLSPGRRKTMPRSDIHQLASWEQQTSRFTDQARTSLVRHSERILAEVPATLRRLRMMMLVLSIAVSMFLGGLLVVLWRLT
jgi:hypothetical protein